ncbi:MAG: ABC transporter permease [Planctomycetes bacterium]|nr:ABC transporter permease [Planctomycetota bacterium]
MLARVAVRRGVAGFLWGVRVVLRRETGAYFDSSIAYVYAAVFLLLAHAVFMNGFFLESVLEMGEYFRALPFLLALFIPAITMRSWAEERSHGTFELVMTLPLRSFEVVLGKYLASILFYLAVLAGSFPIVLMLTWLGEPDLGLIASSYIGAVLLGAFFLALGIFISGLTREQIVAFVLSTFACSLFVLSGQEKVVEVLDGLTPAWQVGTWLHDSVSVLPHYDSFCQGVVSLADAGYFALTSAFFLVMNEVTLKIAKH